VGDAERTRLARPDPMSAHFDLQPAVAAGRTASAASVVLLVQSAAIDQFKQNKPPIGLSLPERRQATFLENVNWLTFVRDYPGQGAGHRKAKADFNFRGWQGR